MKKEILLNAMKQFLNEPEVKTVVETVEIVKGAQWLNTPLKFTVDKISDDDIKIEIQSNGKNGFTRFEKTYNIN